MRLKDYVEQAEQDQIFGYDDIDLISYYIRSEGRLADFSKMYIDLLTGEKEENE